MHEGRCCSELGLPGWPALAEELMVHRDIELARLTGARIHLLHLSTARQRRAGPGGQGRRAAGDGRGRAAPPQPHRRGAARLRPGVQGQPAAAHGGRRRRAQGRPGRRHDRRHRHRPRPAPDRGQGAPDRRRPARACSGWRRRSASRWPSSTCRWSTCVAALSWKPAAIAGVGDRHGRPIEPGSAANLVVFDPDSAGRCVRRPWPAAAATRPYVGRELRGRVRHTVFRGAPVVRDGAAQR